MQLFIYNSTEPLTVVSRNCWLLFLHIHKKRLSLKENNQFAGVATAAKPRHVNSNYMKIKFKPLTFSILFILFSCKQTNRNDAEYNQNRELLPNPEGNQKDTFSAKETNINNICDCPKNDFTETKSDTIYKLSNGKSIALCGFRNVENNPVDFSEFVLSVCGENKIIDFWNATQNCNLRVNKDTLIVEELINLPTQKDRKYEINIWGIDKIYFKDNNVIKKHFINQNVKKYSEKQIAITLKEYENADEELNDEKIEIVNRLFIASISENKKARKYFNEFNTKYKLDGAFAEEYGDLKTMLELWESKKITTTNSHFAKAAKR